jgi:pimeloyl-ACP methyl ester carboxylesterase
MALELQRLSAFRSPALLSSGGQSPPFFPLVVQRIAQALPHARQNVFQQAGHVPHVTHPVEYIRVVTEFIQSVGR